MPVGVAKAMTEAIGIPTMGIGAGRYCDSQDIVWFDMLGFNEWVPKFVKKYADLRSVIIGALNSFADEVDSGAFPTEAQSYNTVVEGCEIEG